MYLLYEKFGEILSSFIYIYLKIHLYSIKTGEKKKWTRIRTIQAK